VSGDHQSKEGSEQGHRRQSMCLGIAGALRRQKRPDRDEFLLRANAARGNLLLLLREDLFRLDAAARGNAFGQIVAARRVCIPRANVVVPCPLFRHTPKLSCSRETCGGVKCRAVSHQAWSFVAVAAKSISD
jgi:hypothetical protein